MTRKLLWSILILISTLPASGQTASVQRYSWEAADLALVYPTGWDAPLPTESEGRLVLQLAQTLVESPDVRPPGISFMTLTLYPASDSNLYDLLTGQLGAVGIVPSGQGLTTWLDTDAVMTDGYSSDGLLYGIGQAVRWADGRVLTLVGRAIADRRGYFTTLFDHVADSLVFGASATPNLPAYGVLWYSERTLADGEEAFLDVISMALATGKLYLLDTDLGVVQMNVQTGVVEAIYSFEGEWVPSDMAVGSDGRIIVTDVACSCARVLKDGQWTFGLGGFGEAAPFSVAAAPDGTVYLTDEDSTGVFLRAVSTSGVQNLPFGEGVTSQPRLLVDRAGRLLALTESGELLRLEGDSFVPVFELGLALPLLQDVTVDANNNLTLLASDRGGVILNAAGEQIEEFGRVTSELPLPGEFLSPRSIVIAPVSTIFIADTDGSFGRVTALSTLVETGQLGAYQLVPNLPVKGHLDEITPHQYWSFVGTKGQQVTLSSLDVDQTGTFDLALRLIDPSGNEEAFNADHDGQSFPATTDAQIRAHPLEHDGRYTVVVERTAGEGTYRLGLVQPQSVDIVENAMIRGELPDVIPANQWMFEGTAGQTWTITMMATSGDLDPMLRLLDGSGMVVAENDDSEDPTFGNAAQLFEVRLPRTGAYVIEAGRFAGTGRYLLEFAAVEAG